MIPNSVGWFFQSPTWQVYLYWSKQAGDFSDLLSCHCTLTNTLLAYRVSVPQSQLWVSCCLVAGHGLSMMQSQFPQPRTPGLCDSQSGWQEHAVRTTHLHFKYQASDDKVQSITLIHLYDAKIPWWEIPQKDCDLGFIWVCTIQHQEAQSVFVNYIIRGALLVKDDLENWEMDYLVVDVVDGDMFLHLWVLIPYSWYKILAIFDGAT